MLTYHVYSDISQRYESIGYAYAIVRIETIAGIQTHYAEWASGFLPNLKSTVEAEILASARALAAVAVHRCDRVKVYTDLDVLPAMMEGGPCSYRPKLSHALDTLDEAARLFKSVEYLRVKSGDGYYRSCHRRAAKAAMAWARESGWFDRHPHHIETAKVQR